LVRVARPALSNLFAETPSVLPYLWMLISALAFACMSEFAGALGDRCHWMITALARTSLVLLFTLCLAALQRTPLVIRGTRALWVRSLAGSISLQCSFYALTHMPPSDAIAVTNTFPIWVAVLSWPLLGERPRLVVWIAVAASVVGSVLISGPSGDSLDRVAVAAAFVSSFLSAVVVIGLNMLHRMPPQAIVIHFSAMATVFVLACMPNAGVTTSDFTSLSPTAIGLLLALGLSATVGQIFLTKAFAAGPASKVSVVALSQVVFCAAMEFGFFGRSFHPATIVGMILVIGPTAWMMLRRDVSKLSAAPVVSNE
jgi:drug/metabolite transporter (DMT)-like permease